MLEIRKIFLFLNPQQFHFFWPQFRFDSSQVELDWIELSKAVDECAKIWRLDMFAEKPKLNYRVPDLFPASAALLISI